MWGWILQTNPDFQQWFSSIMSQHRVVTNAAPQVASARQAIDFAKRSQSERDSRIPRCLSFRDWMWFYFQDIRYIRYPEIQYLLYLITYFPPPFEINLGKPSWFSQKGEWLNMARHFKQPERTHWQINKIHYEKQHAPEKPEKHEDVEKWCNMLGCLCTWK